MKFLLFVLTVRFLAEMAGNKRKNKNTNDADTGVVKNFHPAEFALR